MRDYRQRDGRTDIWPLHPLHKKGSRQHLLLRYVLHSDIRPAADRQGNLKFGPEALANTQSGKTLEPDSLDDVDYHH